MMGEPTERELPGQVVDDERRTVAVAVEVNDRLRHLRVESTARLLDVLRDDFELSSVRDGCSVGMCGACTVLVDGVAVSSCLTLAALCDGARVRTAESLGDDGRPDPVAQAFVDSRAFQCAYCTPGFVIALRGLLDAEPAPSRGRIESWLSGHLCRCGSYARILDAAEQAVRSHAGARTDRAATAVRAEPSNSADSLGTAR